MLKNLLIALAAIAAVFGVIAFVASRTSSDAPAPRPPGAAEPGDAGAGAGRAERPSGARALAALQQIADASQRLMPDGYESVFVTMPLDALRRARPRVRQDVSAAARRDDGLEVWEEDDPEGARVIYLVSARARLVAQVQFASQLRAAEELRAHFEAMSRRYGPPTGIWNCPETAEASAMRRFTWRREGASVMEAVLIHRSTIGLTLVIAPTDDVGRALARSQCAAVRTPEEIGRFPEARELRGAQAPFVRELPARDR